MKFRIGMLAAAVSLVACSPALAHPQHLPTPGDGLLAGFSHPWFGLDHLLAMVAVGLLAVQLGGRAVWALPMTFLGSMVLGGVGGIADWELGVFEIGLVEIAIALSVVLLGGALAAGKRYPLLLAALFVAGCGWFHGHAHGTEIPALAAPALYVAGFIAATALLHVVGVIGGATLLRRQPLALALRFSGAAISLAGVLILFKTL